MTTTASSVHAALDSFSRLWEPDDVVEVRAFNPGRQPVQDWHLAQEFPSLGEYLIQLNRDGFNVYAGINPRKVRGTPGVKAEDCRTDRPCGGCARCVALARCLFVDADDTTTEDLERRIDEAALPYPTVLMDSGHGAHAYWRLAAPITDLNSWRRHQQGLIRELGTDPAIHDPPRIMRLPGLDNLKDPDNPVPCRIARASDDATGYDIAEFRESEPTRGSISDSGRAKIETGRHEYLREIGRQLRADVGLSDPALRAALKAERDAVLANPQEKSDAEVDRLADWIIRKIKPATATVPPSFPEPVDLADLEGNADPEFKVDGYVAVGHSTELVGFWKAGKTTLLAHWLRGFVGHANAIGVKPASVLMITEEHRNHWVRRCERHGLAGAKIIVRPFGGSKPSLRGWTSFIEHVAMIVERDGVEVVIFDTFTNLGPLEDENDAAQMIAALNPVNMITEAGAAVILVHHSRKGDGDQAQASRGSGALPGFVDVIVELRRFRPSDHDDTRRVLTAYGRFEHTPPEVVFDLGEDGYVLLGTKQDIAKAGRQFNIAKVLPTGLDKALSVKEVGERWEQQFGTDPPTEGSLRDDLRIGFKAGKWHRVGAGVKGDPHKYFNEEQEADG